MNIGNIGYIDEFEELHVIDRIDDGIIIYSHKIYSRDIERFILNKSEVADCAGSRFKYNLYTVSMNHLCIMGFPKDL